LNEGEKSKLSRDTIDVFIWGAWHIRSPVTAILIVIMESFVDCGRGVICGPCLLPEMREMQSKESMRRISLDI
jgi:hypothetical protein